MRNIRHYIRNHKLDTGLFVAVIGLATAIIILLPSAMSHGKPAAKPRPRPAVTTVASWYAKTGQADLAAISGDLERVVIAGQGVSTDLQAQNYIAVQGGDSTVLSTDATQLSTDAALALAQPPPAPLDQNWDTAMRGLKVVGDFDSQAATAMQQGQYGKATVYIDMANTVITSQVNPALQKASQEASGQ